MKPIDLLAEDGHVLLAEARKIASVKDSLFAAHVIIDSHCSIDPPCRHCNWRARDMLQTDYRKRMSTSDVIQRAKQAKEDGLDKLYMVTGCLGDNPPDFVYDYVGAVKQNVDIEVYTMLGAISRSSLEHLKGLGLDGYYCGLESPNPDVYAAVRPGDKLEKRIATLRDAKSMGMKTWSGFILGLGENQADIAKGIELLKDLETDTVSFGMFHPAAYTEMEQGLVPQYLGVAKTIAATRIYMKDVDLFTGYDFVEWGFLAGCNGVCSPNAYFSINSPEAARLKTMRRRVLGEG
jgi:biotin synthase